MKKAQQEIAGFVIIVVLVMVAIFIFLVISVTREKKEEGSKEVEALLTSLLKQTTECIIREPEFENIGGLIKNAFDSFPQNCKNLNKNSQEYLEELIKETMDNVLKMETNFEEYQLDILQGEAENESVIRSFSKKGGCYGKSSRGADAFIGNEIRVYLRIC